MLKFNTTIDYIGGKMERKSIALSFVDEIENLQEDIVKPLKDEFSEEGKFKKSNDLIEEMKSDLEDAPEEVMTVMEAMLKDTERIKTENVGIRITPYGISIHSLGSDEGLEEAEEKISEILSQNSIDFEKEETYSKDIEEMQDIFGLDLVSIIGDYRGSFNITGEKEDINVSFSSKNQITIESSKEVIEKIKGELNE